MCIYIYAYIRIHMYISNTVTMAAFPSSQWMQHQQLPRESV